MHAEPAEIADYDTPRGYMPGEILGVMICANEPYSRPELATFAHSNSVQPLNVTPGHIARAAAAAQLNFFPCRDTRGKMHRPWYTGVYPHDILPEPVRGVHLKADILARAEEAT